MVFNSINQCESVAVGWEGLFEHDRGSTQIKVEDTLISSEAVGSARATAELLKGGYDERWVSITSIHIPGIRQNTIVEFKGFKWIVKEVSYSFYKAKLLMTVKGLRYE